VREIDFGRFQCLGGGFADVPADLPRGDRPQHILVELVFLAVRRFVVSGHRPDLFDPRLDVFQLHRLSFTNKT